MTQIVRSTITGAKPESEMREVQTLYNSTSVQDDMEHLEPYGFTSEPFTDGQTDAVNLYFDDERNHGVVINIADRRYRITGMKSGEVAIYDNQKRHVYLKQDCIEIDGVDSPINVKTSDTINANANVVNVTAPNVNIKGDVTITGNVTINGNTAINGGMTATQGMDAGGSISAGGDISANGDVTAGSISLQSHVHGGVESGSSTTSQAQ